MRIKSVERDKDHVDRRPKERTVHVKVAAFKVFSDTRFRVDEKFPIAYYLYPRSSISKTPLIMANSVGIIDKDYRGNIMAKVRNIPLKNKDYEKESYFESYHIEKGTRLFQICSPDLSPLKVVVVNLIV